MNDYKVFVVVDVQNCFIQGGSLSTPLIEHLPGYINQARTIHRRATTGGYDLIVFSRDFHPEYHSSLYHEMNAVKGVYPPHCRDASRECDRRYIGDTSTKKNVDNQVKTTGAIIDSILSPSNASKLSEGDIHFLRNIPRNIEVHGTDLSYLFYGFPDFVNSMDILNSDTAQIHTIGLKRRNTNGGDNKSYKFPPSKINLKYADITKVPNTNIIALTKGQYCDYESYSAFNYHIHMQNHTELPNQNKKVSDNNLVSLPVNKEYTTGLFEYIIMMIRQNSLKSRLIIDVCGLVTNICVINTVQQGLAMWNKVYKSKIPQITQVVFNLLDELSIPLPLPIPVDFLEYNYGTPINTREQLEKAKTLYKAKFEVDIFGPNNITSDYEKMFYNFNIINNIENDQINYFPHNTPVSKIISSSLKNKYITVSECNCNNSGCTNCTSQYKLKYLKYKQKYIDLKNKLN